MIFKILLHCNYILFELRKVLQVIEIWWKNFASSPSSSCIQLNLITLLRIPFASQLSEICENVFYSDLNIVRTENNLQKNEPQNDASNDIKKNNTEQQSFFLSSLMVYFFNVLNKDDGKNCKLQFTFLSYTTTNSSLEVFNEKKS